MTDFMENAEECLNMSCVNANIDVIDSQIVALIGQRLAYARRTRELRGSHVDIGAQITVDPILNKVARQAEVMGYSPLIARSIFAAILLQTNLTQQLPR
ncbi:MAG: chorismate mutase [Coxiellaceae bacterium]|nr:MAG: chorismate mutase [Coxiellaceae bacterium]